MSNATWTQTRTTFANGDMGKTYANGRLAVIRATHVERGTEGWVFQYTGLFGTETHRGFPTMAAAKAAAVTFLTSPIR